MTEHERLALAEEAHDLSIHVRMCAMRHAQILARVEDADAQIRARIERADADAKAWRSRMDKGAWALITAVGTMGGASLLQMLPAIRAFAGQ